MLHFLLVCCFTVVMCDYCFFCSLFGVVSLGVVMIAASVFCFGLYLPFVFGVFVFVALWCCLFVFIV